MLILTKCFVIPAILSLVILPVVTSAKRRFRGKTRLDIRQPISPTNPPSNHPILEWANPAMPTKTFRDTITSQAEFDCRVSYKDLGRDYDKIWTIHWLKNGLPVKYDRRGRIRKIGMQLVVSDLRPSDKGNYTCVVEAGGQKMQWHFFVEVESASASCPAIINPPVNQTAVVGSRVIFTCESNPYMSDVQMMWFKHVLINGSWGEGKLQENDSHITVLKDWNLTHGPLILEDVSPRDQGYYTCSLKNKQGDDFQSAYLTVIEEKESNADKEEELPMLILVPAIAGGIISVISITIVIVCIYRHRLQSVRMQKTQIYYNNREESDMCARRLVKDRRISSSSSCHSCSSGLSTKSRPRVPSHDPWEFPRKRLHIQGLLGEGAFGMVKKAMAYGIGHISKSCLVAVKTIKSSASIQDQMEFEKELEITKAVREMGSHLNVINFMGYCTKDGPLWMIVEFAEKGNLRDYLISFRSQVSLLMTMDTDSDSSSPTSSDDGKLSQKLLLSFCHQIARGMEFLASVKCIHRDLAARNVLVTKDDVLKVADFGLARNGDYYKKTSTGQLPVKWMPPEALLHMMYTEKSDVWSFGIVMWEIFSLGGMPYPMIRHENLYSKLMEGYRMERPHFAPESLYATMRKCWNHLPQNRPDFSILVLILERQLVRIANGGYIEVLADDDDDDADGAVGEISSVR